MPHKDLCVVTEGEDGNEGKGDEKLNGEDQEDLMDEGKQKQNYWFLEDHITHKLEPDCAFYSPS